VHFGHELVAACVIESNRIVALPDVFIPPSLESEQHRRKCSPGVGESVLVSLGARTVLLAGDHTVIDQLSQSRREDVAWGPGITCDVGEPSLRVEEFANDEQTPSIAHDLERVGDGAVPRGLLGGCVRHVEHSHRSGLCFQTDYANVE
jgi:hypothetical protein